MIANGERELAEKDSAVLSISTSFWLSANVMDFQRVRDRLLISAADCLGRLIKLPVGWDGYHAQPVGFLNADFALSILNRICGPETPPPQIVPGSTGELQIEWHTLQGDIELYVKGPNNVRAWRAMANGDLDGEELDLTVDFTVVAQWVKEIEETRVGALVVTMLR